jgi:peptidoglycan/LPS O-acetylase OafA/YrhL
VTGDRRAPAGSARIEALDALRGLAALSVVLNHCAATVPALLAGIGRAAPADLTLAGIVTHSPIRIVFAGNEAVLLFFILSGLVLARPYAAGRAAAYGVFLWRRLTRIYLPYVAAVGISLGLLVLGAGAAATHGTSRWLDAMWSRSPTPDGLLDVVLLLDRHRAVRESDIFNVLSPAWSLVHELRLAFVFPLIAWVALRLDWRATLSVALAWSGCLDRLLSQAAEAGDDISYTWLYSAYVASFVLIGALLARHWSHVVARARALPRWAVAALALLAWALYGWRWLTGWWTPSLGGDLISDWATAGGVVLLLVLAGGGRLLPGALAQPVLVWLGRVSYSLYLTHVLVLLILVHALAAYPLWLPLLLVVPISLPAAAVFHHLVEAPAHRLATRVLDRAEAPPWTARARLSTLRY